MYLLTVKINHLTGEEPDELNLRFARRETAREMATRYFECEDVYCVEMTNGLTGEILFYEYKY
jgi:hypothetical protein